MVKCCVVNCTSGYKSNPEKISEFCAPKNLELRAKWTKAIPRKYNRQNLCVLKTFPQ